MNRLHELWRAFWGLEAHERDLAASRQQQAVIRQQQRRVQVVMRALETEADLLSHRRGRGNGVSQS